MTEIERFFDQLHTRGGCIVSTDQCSPEEIAAARDMGMFFADHRGLGYVRRPNVWLARGEGVRNGFRVKRVRIMDASHRSIRRGDSLYVRGDSGPVCGDVLCHGRDGVTVCVDGNRMQVPWDGVLGHKQRVEVRANVVDHGEDGAIIEDDDGARSYVHGLAFGDEAEDDETDDDGGGEMGEYGRVLFAKAGSASGIPGQETRGDSGAGDSRRVSSVVQFRSSTGHALTGEIVASGDDGVMVMDDRGGEHRVKHGQYTGADKSDTGGKDRTAQKPRKHSDVSIVAKCFVPVELPSGHAVLFPAKIAGDLPL